MIFYYKSKSKQKGFMRCMEMVWWEKYPTATLNMKQLNNQRYSIMEHSHRTSSYRNSAD